jgi:ribose 5-phosphate isomerase RpiB
VEIYLDRDDTKIGEVISKPKDYWYSVTLNDDTVPQTIIGYDDDGAKVFKLFPEGADVPPYEPIKPEDIPIVDAELDLTSTRPVENQAVARAIVALQADYEETKETVLTATEETAEALSVERSRLDNLISGKDTTYSGALEYMDYITAETQAKMDATITSDGVYAAITVNLREANLFVGGSGMEVFIIPNECRPIDVGVIHTEDGLTYAINYNNVNNRYVLAIGAKSDVVYAPSGAGNVTISYALADYELKDIRVGAYGEYYSTAGDAVRSTEAAVFETEEVQHNVFNPANTTRQNVFEYDHIVSEVIPCSVGDVVYVRVGEDLSTLSRFGVCYVSGEGELVYPTATADGSYTIEKPESFAELAGIKVLVREDFVPYDDRDTIMVTINEAPTEFVEWTKDGKRKVSRIDELSERVDAIANPDDGLARLVEFEKRAEQDVSWYDSYELYATEAYPTTYGNFYYSKNWSGVTYAPCEGAKAVNVLICSGGKDSHRGFVFYDADKKPIKGYVFPTTDEGITEDATYPVPEGAVYYQTCIQTDHKADFYARLVVDTNIKVELDKEINRASVAENKINAELTLTDKKVLVIGDSISTDYYGNYEKWVTKLVKQGFFSADKVTNDSIHATGFVASLIGDKTDCFLPRLKAVENPAEYDIVIVFGGINDYFGHQSQNITFSDFAGAVDSFFHHLIKTFVNARICVFRPLKSHQTWATDEGKYQQDYSEYINTVAKSYCLPVLNLTEESGFYPWITDFKNRWTFTDWVGGDGTVGHGVHPSEEWEETRLAPMVKSFLR